MPDITQETPREAYTIAGETFNVFQPYSAGHILTSGEADALNQTYAENIRNNYAAKVKEAKEAGTFDLEVFQANLDDYMGEYEFGVRRGGGGRVGDPVMAEALSIARDKVREALKKAGHNLKDVAASDVTRLAKDVLNGQSQGGEQVAEAIMNAARARVEAQRELGSIDLGGATVSAPDTEVEAEGSKRKRA